jgi:hypothetical protein
VDYWLAAPARRVVLSFYDRGGRLIRRFSSDDAAPPPIPHLDKPAYWERPFVRPSAQSGMHRFVWDLRVPDPRSLQQDLPISAVPHDTPRTPQGPLVLPGIYEARLDVDGRVQQRTFEVLMDPRVTISPQALAEQYRLATLLTTILNRSYDASTATHDDAQASAWARLNEAAAALLDTIEGADAPPTTQATQAVATLQARLDALGQAH